MTVDEAKGRIGQNVWKDEDKEVVLLAWWGPSMTRKEALAFIRDDKTGRKEIVPLDSLALWPW